MTEENFVHKTLDKLLEVIEVELKLPLGIAEVKVKPTEIAKEWRENEKKRNELENAIQRAEEKFIKANKDQKVAQMLRELPLFSEGEFKQVIANLLTHLSEEKITWLAEIQLTRTWGNVASAEDIRKALELYLPYLRHELNSIKEFREVISALTLERIDETTRRIESKLDKVLDSQSPKSKENETDFWLIPHPYPMPPNFTGRKTELEILDNWLADNTNRLFILRALGGFGKSALAWHWLTNDVDSKECPRVLWWDFYQGEVNFTSFLGEALQYLNSEIPKGERNQVDQLLKIMQSQKILIVMDGFERLLKAYQGMNASYQGDEETSLEENQFDCVNINVEWFLKGVCARPNFKSKVLMTTRLTPRAVLDRHSKEMVLGCREVELTSMQPADAVEFFYKKKIIGARFEIEAACAPYDYHPLSLRILAGQILRHFHNRCDIVVAQKLKIDGDLKAQRHHILEVAYNGLSEKGQKLLSTIACFRSSVEFKTLEAVVENKDTLDSDLHDLVDRGLLNFDEKNKRFDLHPIVRRYAYEQLSTSDRISIHNVLINYFASLNIPNQIINLEDISSRIELCYHLAKAERIDEAALTYVSYLHDPIYLQFNSYQLGVGLLTNMFTNGEGKIPPANRYDLQASILNHLGMLYGRLGQPSKSIFLREAGIALIIQNVQLKNLYISLGQPGKSFLPEEAVNNFTNKTSDKFTLSNLYSNLAFQEISLGRLKSAEENLRLSMSLIEDYNADYLRRSLLGYILSYCGMWSEAEQELAIAGEWLEEAEQEFATSASQKDKDANYQLQALNWSYISFYFLLKCHEDLNSYNLKSAVNAAFRALELAHKDKNPIPHDLMYIRWLLGATIHAGGNLVEAEKNLYEALRICRSINAIDHEANNLLHIALLRFHQKNYDEAKSLADEALLITERCGYVLQGADVNLFLAQYALEQEKDKAKAKQYAEEAKKLATCDGPPYYYKVAYEEAERFLAQLQG